MRREVEYIIANSHDGRNDESWRAVSSGTLTLERAPIGVMTRGWDMRLSLKMSQK